MATSLTGQRGKKEEEEEEKRVNGQEMRRSFDRRSPRWIDVEQLDEWWTSFSPATQSALIPGGSLNRSGNEVFYLMGKHWQHTARDVAPFICFPIDGMHSASPFFDADGRRDQCNLLFCFYIKHGKRQSETPPQRHEIGSDRSSAGMTE